MSTRNDTILERLVGLIPLITDVLVGVETRLKWEFAKFGRGVKTSDRGSQATSTVTASDTDHGGSSVNMVGGNTDVVEE